jgi:general secretion pathway protein G
MTSDHKEKTKMSYSKTTKCSTPASDLGESAVVPWSDGGFTLIELTLCVAIISVLSLLALSAYPKVRDRAMEIRCISEIRELARTINAYSIDHNGEYPADWATMGISAPTDPWGNVYEISAPTRVDLGVTINVAFDLYSKGPDGQTDPDIDHEDSMDDVVIAGDGSYLGSVQNFLP